MSLLIRECKIKFAIMPHSFLLVVFRIQELLKTVNTILRTNVSFYKRYITDY